jgi:hypothetical protein
MAAEAKKSSIWTTISRVTSILTPLLAVAAIYLALKKPEPVSAPQAPAVIAANAQSFQNKVDQLAQAQASGQTGTEVHLTSGEVNAAILQSSGAIPAQTSASASNGTPDINAPIAPGAVDINSLGEPKVTFDGDVMKGQFQTELGGKQVTVTLAGRLGSKDGYANFEPTEFKVGDLDVPVSLVSDALQKKMLEQRDRLKLPDYVSDMRVENGELVVKQK